MTESPPDVYESDLARSIARISKERLGDPCLRLIGRHPTLLAAQRQAVQFARADAPVLITGETGVGVVFLDEIAELSMPAQSMLLRSAREKWCVSARTGHAASTPGSSLRPLTICRPWCAVARSARTCTSACGFCGFASPCASGGDDWRLLLDFHVDRLNARFGTRKAFSPEAMQRLSKYSWPGNVRELQGIVEAAFHSYGDVLQVDDLADDPPLALSPVMAAPAASAVVDGAGEREAALVHDLFRTLKAGRTTFWDAVHPAYLSRELNKAEVRQLVSLGLQDSRGSYKRLLGLFGVEPGDYLRFMDFLRHHSLKPHGGVRAAAAGRAHIES